MKKIIQWIDRFYWKSGIADDVPALTYFFLISLLPFSLGLVVLTTLLFGDFLTSQDLNQQLNGILSPEMSNIIYDTVSKAQSNSPLLLAIALFSMLWTSSGAIGIIERALSRITNSRRYPTFLGKLRNIALSGLVALAILFGIAATVMGAGVADSLELSSFWVKGTPVLHLIGSTLLCSLLFRYVIKDRVSWKHALQGGAFTAVILQLTPFLIGLYIKTTTPSLEQFFITLALVILTCYLLSLAFMFGIGITTRAWYSHTMLDPIKPVLQDGDAEQRAYLSSIENRLNILSKNYIFDYPKKVYPLSNNHFVFESKIQDSDQPIFGILSTKSVAEYDHLLCLPQIMVKESDCLIFHYNESSNKKLIMKDQFDLEEQAILLDSLHQLRQQPTNQVSPHMFPKLWEVIYDMFPEQNDIIAPMMSMSNVFVPGNCYFDMNKNTFIDIFPSIAPKGLLETIILHKNGQLNLDMLQKYPECTVWAMIVPQIDWQDMVYNNLINTVTL